MHTLTKDGEKPLLKVDKKPLQNTEISVKKGRKHIHVSPRYSLNPEKRNFPERPHKRIPSGSMDQVKEQNINTGFESIRRYKQEENITPLIKHGNRIIKDFIDNITADKIGRNERHDPVPKTPTIMQKPFHNHINSSSRRSQTSCI